MPSFRVETAARCYSAIVERGIAGARLRVPSAQGRQGLCGLHRGRVAAPGRGAGGGRWRASTTKLLHLPGGEEQKRLAPVEQLAEEMVRARRRPLQPGGRLRRRHRQRYGRFPGRHFHARHSGDPDSHHAAGAGGCRHRRQDRREPGERQEPGGRFHQPLAVLIDPADCSIRCRTANTAPGCGKSSRPASSASPSCSASWPNTAPTCWRASRRRWTASSPIPCA